MEALSKGRGRAALLPTNLLSLQNLLKRDPPLYRDEFREQLVQYESTLLRLKQNAAAKAPEFAGLVDFLAQVSSCYPEETKKFPDDLAQLLSAHHNVLDLDLREKLVQSLVLLRNKGVVDSISVLTTFFPLLSESNSKMLRAHLYESIIAVIKTENQKTKNASLNRKVQNILLGMVEEDKKSEQWPDEAAGLWAVRLTKELWIKNIWAGDARVANICMAAAISKYAKVMLGGIHFFLGVDADDIAGDEDGSKEIDLRKLQHQAGINKLSKNRANKVKKAMVSEKKKRNSKKTPALLNFSALQILYDPQQFAQRLFSFHLAGSKPMTFEHKLLVINLLARLIGYHKLTILTFYSFLLKWVSPHQRDVTKILAALAGASHEFVPPDILEPCIKQIADNFVTSGVSPEVVCAGLNSIREICTRNPLCMDATLLQDLTEYKGSKDKGVMMASRSLITLYRDVAPEMLKKKDRGKSAAIGVANGTNNSARFGVERGVVRGIEGLDLLEEFYAQQTAERAEMGEPEDENSEDGWEGFDVDESDSDDGGEGWIDVVSDGDDIEFSDSDDDMPAKSRTTKSVPDKRPGLVNTAEEGEEVAKTTAEEVAAEESNLRSFATTRILTPADFKRLAELKAGMTSGKRSTHHATTASKRALPSADFIDAIDIEGPRKKAKQDLEARLASIAEGRKDRAAFGSRKGQRTEEGRSTTNKEKARKKNFLMVKHRRDIQGKSMKKLTIKRKELKAHIDRGRRGGKRGNK